MQNTDKLQAWCALWRTPRIGAKRFAAILKVFGTPENFFSASISQQKKAGIALDSKTQKDVFVAAEADIAWLNHTPNGHIITLYDNDYPDQLRTIDDPPPLLFARGNIALLAEPQLAIVGSRSASHEGLENARQFAKYLTQNGIVITSGLATGIDGAAHHGALAADSQLSGQTIAVMATGPDRIYPAKHQELAYRIIERGCIVTELPVVTPVVPHAFPRRNRMISGLSLGTLVVEAGLKSGSLITARTALEQNREVFAIPGSIHNPLARGCNHLIRNGAKLVETAKDIFEEIQPTLLTFVENEKSASLNNKPLNKTAKAELETGSDKTGGADSRVAKDDVFIAGDPARQQLWQALSYEPQPVDILAQRSGLAANQVSSTLLILELAGYVSKYPGGRYQKIDKTHEI
ncbi:MAG: DNA-protecting protein DprA [Gammaproteobacteria bacterium]|nr:MAG: DNA-protecting protein DprA [Gammaproteobacteria bacterium]